jgi:hypothetical protein
VAIPALVDSAITVDLRAPDPPNAREGQRSRISILCLSAATVIAPGPVPTEVERYRLDPKARGASRTRPASAR